MEEWEHEEMGWRNGNMKRWDGGMGHEEMEKWDGGMGHEEMGWRNGT